MLRPMSVGDGYSGVKKKGRSPRCGESTDNTDGGCDTVKSSLQNVQHHNFKQKI